MYSSLRGDRSFRLLVLFPGTTEERVRCRLDTCSLDDCKPYEALSYVWGEPKFHHAIECNGQTVCLTQNLQSALVKLRHADKEHILWIDQLCINQNDLVERGQQVCLMGDIYSHASSVLVWLGESDVDTETVWNLLGILQKVMEFRTPQLYHLATGGPPECFENAPADPDTGVSRAIPPLPSDVLDVPKNTSEQWKAMERFFSRPWFLRTWTFQEVVLSRVCNVYCGGFHIPWDMLSTGATALRLAGYGPYVGGRHGFTESMNTHKIHHASGKRARLAYLLSSCRSRQATNAHDRLYGVLGLVDPRTAERITVDYARSVAETYADGVRACIVDQACLEVFTYIEVRRIDDHGLPSWVPDWRFKGSTRVSLGMRNLDGKRYFNAAGNTKPLLVPTDCWKTLRLKGFLFKQISRFLDVRTALRLDDACISQGSLVSSRWSPKFWSSMYRTAVELLEIPKSCVKQPEQLDHFIAFLWKSYIRDPPPPEDQLETAFRHTLMADLFPRLHGHCIEDGHFPAYQSWEYHFFRRNVPPQVLLEHDQFVIDAMFNREFFIAGEEPDAYMGITLGTVREGDWVCVLAGGDTPFVLRPLAQKPGQDAADVEEWEFVGDCYLHGIMDGEAMTRTKEPDFQYQEFSLI